MFCVDEVFQVSENHPTKEAEVTSIFPMVHHESTIQNPVEMPKNDLRMLEALEYQKQLGSRKGSVYSKKSPTGPTWRIIPVSKWLITMVSKSPKWGYSPSKWPKWLLNRAY